MKYQDGKIYKILNSESNDIYIYIYGLYLLDVIEKNGKHRTKARQGSNVLLYQKLREIGESKFHIELVKAYHCQILEQLKKGEGEWMRDIATMNEQVAGRTKQEYNDDNREVKKDKSKEHYQENREQAPQPQRAQYQETTD